MKKDYPKSYQRALLAFYHASAFILVLLSSKCFAQSSNIPTLTLPAVADGCMAWGDFDQDGDPDLYQSGINVTGQISGGVYQLSGSALTPYGLSPIALVRNGFAAWADYDQDGDLDLSIMGDTAIKRPATIIYQNQGGIMSPLPVQLPGLAFGKLVWADLDGDNDLDLLIQGWHPERLNEVYLVRQTTPGSFLPIRWDALCGFQNVGFELKDLNLDGKSDLLFTGKRPLSNDTVVALWQGSNGNWTPIPNPLKPAFGGGAACLKGGAASLAVISGTNQSNSTQVMRLHQGTLVPAMAQLPLFEMSDMCVADLDNDNDEDLIIAGITSAAGEVRIYRHMPNLLSPWQSLPLFSGILRPRISVLDWNLDGYKDIHVMGIDTNNQPINRIFTRNPQNQSFQ